MVLEEIMKVADQGALAKLREVKPRVKHIDRICEALQIHASLAYAQHQGMEVVLRTQDGRECVLRKL